MKKNTIAKLLTAALCTGLIAGMTTGCGSATLLPAKTDRSSSTTGDTSVDTITMFEENRHKRWFMMNLKPTKSCIPR